MLDWIIEGLRMILWGFTSACLKLMDICYSLITKIAVADFLADDLVWQWYYTFMLFMGVLIIIRSVSVFLKFSFDEEFREKVNGTHFMNKLISISLVIALLPFCLGFVSQLSSWGIKNISMFLGTQSSDEPSTLIVTAFMNTDNGEFDAEGNWLSGDKVTFTVEDIDINAEGEGDETFKYFNDFADVFIIAFIGITAAIMLIINGIQVGKRMYSIVMKLCIAPIPISSLIVPGDEVFSMWRKMIVSDYLLNFVQTIMIIMIMILSGSKIIQNMGMWVQIISFISGLLLLLSGIPELARIVGGDTSQGNVIQQLASFRMATRGFGHGAAAVVGGAVGAIAGGVKGLGSLATYGAGRMLGGKSINDMNKINTPGKGDGGFMGGSSLNDVNSNSSIFNTGGKEKSNASSKIFNESAAGKQQNAGGKLGDSNTENMSNEDAAHALEKAGADKSFMGGSNANNNINTLGSNGNDYATFNENNDATVSSSFGNNVDGGNTFASNDNMNNQKNPNASSAKESLTKTGSAAHKFSNTAMEMPGFRGGVAKLASNASSHLYQKSAQRISQTKVYRSGQYAQRTFNDLKGVYKGDDISSSSKL